MVYGPAILAPPEICYYSNFWLLDLLGISILILVTMRYHLTLSEWPPSKKSLQIINAGEEKGNPPTLLVGMEIGTASTVNSMEFP